MKKTPLVFSVSIVILLLIIFAIFNKASNACKVNLCVVEWERKLIYQNSGYIGNGAMDESNVKYYINGDYIGSGSQACGQIIERMNKCGNIWFIYNTPIKSTVGPSWANQPDLLAKYHLQCKSILTERHAALFIGNSLKNINYSDELPSGLKMLGK